MSRDPNTITTEAMTLGLSGRMTQQDFVRLWSEMNTTLIEKGRTASQRADVLAAIEGFAQPEWLALTSLEPQAPARSA